MLICRIKVGVVKSSVIYVYNYIFNGVLLEVVF